jgi:hypothetical protein
MPFVRLRGAQDRGRRDGSDEGGGQQGDRDEVATVAEIHEQLTRAGILHQEDLASGLGRVSLSEALDRKFPSAARDWRWQWSSRPPSDGRGKMAARDAITTTRRTSSVP